MPSKSKAQQALMGMVHAYQTGRLPNASKKVKDMANSMNKQDVTDFASTKTQGLPKKVAQVKKGELDTQTRVTQGLVNALLLGGGLGAAGAIAGDTPESKRKWALRGLLFGGGLGAASGLLDAGVVRLTRSGDVPSDAQIIQDNAQDPVRFAANTLLNVAPGALAGAGIGALSAADDKRQRIRHALTGALIGGAITGTPRVYVGGLPQSMVHGKSAQVKRSESPSVLAPTALGAGIGAFSGLASADPQSPLKDRLLRALNWAAYGAVPGAAYGLGRVGGYSVAQERAKQAAQDSGKPDADSTPGNDFLGRLKKIHVTNSPTSVSNPGKAVNLEKKLSNVGVQMSPEELASLRKALALKLGIQTAGLGAIIGGGAGLATGALVPEGGIGTRLANALMGTLVGAGVGGLGGGALGYAAGKSAQVKGGAVDGPHGPLQPRKNLQPPTTLDAVNAIEAGLGYRLPTEYKDFLLRSDGGKPTESMILFSVGKGIHPSETLQAANQGRQGLPLVHIGRFADEEFGFLRDDTGGARRPVYSYEHETGKTKQLAASFEEFLRAALSGTKFPTAEAVGDATPTRALGYAAGKSAQVKRSADGQLPSLYNSGTDPLSPRFRAKGTPKSPTVSPLSDAPVSTAAADAASLKQLEAAMRQNATRAGILESRPVVTGGVEDAPGMSLGAPNVGGPLPLPQHADFNPNPVVTGGVEDAPGMALNVPQIGSSAAAPAAPKGPAAPVAQGGIPVGLLASAGGLAGGLVGGLSGKSTQDRLKRALYGALIGGGLGAAGGLAYNSLKGAQIGGIKGQVKRSADDSPTSPPAINPRKTVLNSMGLGALVGGGIGGMVGGGEESLQKRISRILYGAALGSGTGGLMGLGLNSGYAQGMQEAKKAAMSQETGQALTGGAVGALAGAGIGALTGKDRLKRALVGALVGGGLGAAAVYGGNKVLGRTPPALDWTAPKSPPVFPGPLAKMNKGDKPPTVGQSLDANMKQVDAATAK